MSEPLPPWLANVDPRFVRHDWKKWLRPDWRRWMPPDPGPSMRERLWRPYREESSAETAPSATESAALSALRLQLAVIKAELRRKAGFNPAQPRDDHGRWTDAGGQNDPRILSDATPDNNWKPGAQYAQNVPRGPYPERGPVLINGQLVQPTPGQAARLTIAEAQARDAVGRVRELDPNWRPQPSAYAGVEGLIRAHESDANQAQARITELARVGIGPGPSAGESIPARGPERDFTAAERREINRMGSETGCHTCGTTDPGTRRNNFVPDHQPPNALNSSGRTQRLFPQCIWCSGFQGGWIRGNKVGR